MGIAVHQLLTVQDAEECTYCGRILLDGKPVVNGQRCLSWRGTAHSPHRKENARLPKVKHTEMEMARATIKDNTLYVEIPFSAEGKVTASKKNLLHATTENGTPDALSIEEKGRKIFVQVNAYSKRVKQAAPAAK